MPLSTEESETFRRENTLVLPPIASLRGIHVICEMWACALKMVAPCTEWEGSDEKIFVNR
jgi:hypothetical protein